MASAVAQPWFAEAAAQIPDHRRGWEGDRIREGSWQRVPPSLRAESRDSSDVSG